jgi:hypothetical protein
MLHKDYNRKCSVEKNVGRGSQGACCQDELIGGKPPVVKKLLTLILTLTLEVKSHVEAGLNTSTVALRVIGGDENGTLCWGV